MTCYKPTEETLNYYKNHRLEPQERTLNVISVCGRSRIGKTTCLKHLFGITDAELASRPGFKVVTQGIDQVMRSINISSSANHDLKNGQANENAPNHIA